MANDAAPRRQTVTGGRSASRGYIAGDVALAVGKPTGKPPEGFRWIALTDLARLETGHTPSRRAAKYWNGDIPWVGIRDATSNHGRTITSTREYITEEGEANSSARLLPAHTVCLSRTASVGYVVVMGVPMATSQDFVNWVCGPDLDYRYLKYVLLAEHNSVLRFASGTTHQTIYFPEVKAFHACLPGVSEQRAIAEVLGVLDDKIESNRRIARDLRDLSATLIAAAGSRERRVVGDLVEFHNRQRVPLSAKERAEMPGPYPYYGATGIFDYVDQYLFDERLLLVGEDGSVIHDDGTPVTQYVWDRCWVNNHAHVLTGSSVSTELAYLVIAQADVRPSITGAVQAKLSMGNLKAVPVEVPSGSDLPAVESEIAPLFARMRVAYQEIDRLTALREALLPELLSGRFRVNDATNLAEALT